MILFRIALRQLLNERAFVTFFVSNFAAALFAVFAVLMLRSAIDRAVEASSKELAGADLVVSVRRAFTETETRELTEVVSGLVSKGRSETRAVRIVDTVSMIGTATRSRLAGLRAIQPEYPLYGEVTALPPADLLPERGAWVDPQLAVDLALEVGSTVRIGGQSFRVAGLIEKDDTQSFANLSIAPRVYLRLQDLEQTEIASRGSVAFHRYLIRTNAVDEAKGALEARLTANEIRIRGHRENSIQQALLLSYLSDYLGLIGLLALLIVGVGLGFQVRRFLNDQINDYAVFLSQGASLRQLATIWLAQISALALVSAALALLAATLAVPLVNPIVRQLTPIASAISVADAPLFVGPLAAWSGALVISLPTFVSLRNVSVKALLRQDAEGSGALAAWTFVPAAMYFAVLAFWASPSFYIAGGFMAGLAVGVALLALLFTAGLRLLPTRGVRGAWGVVLRSVRRRSRVSLLLMVTLGMTFLLAGVVPSVEASLKAEIEPDSATLVPELFLFDIQEEQVASVRRFLEPYGELTSMSPLVRARLVEVNDEPFERVEGREDGGFETREQQQEAWRRNRGFNLSYREKLSAAETLTAGKWWDTRTDELPEVAALSVETRSAARNGWKLGDKLVFDVQGVPVEGRIRSMRRVRWSAFQPNFRILFPPGYLEPAPKTFLATYRGSTDRDVRPELLREYPNVSAVDVTRALDSLSTILEQVLFAISAMETWALLASLLTFASILRFEVVERRTELNLLRVLGASPRRARQVFILETVITGALPIALGSALSLGLAWTCTQFLLEIPFRPNLLVTLGLFVVGLIFLFGLAIVLASWILRQSSMALLGETRG